MIVRAISRKSGVCGACRGSVVIEEDEQGLYLKCTMCSRNVELRLRTHLRRSGGNNPTVGRISRLRTPAAAGA